MTRVVLVPLDDRPSTRDFPSQLAPLVSWTVERPPDDLLGRFTTAGDCARLEDWLSDHLPTADVVILSSDMLLFGGLVASRALGVDETETRARLQRLRALIEKAPHPVDLFSILMRVPPFCTSDRDRRFSDRLLEYSRRAVRAGDRPGPLTRLRLASLRRGIPADFLGRYMSTRRRNLDVNREVIEWARQRVVDFVLIGMDDSKTEGFNVAEREQLIPLLPRPHADLLPGADEVALLLLARRALLRAGERPRIAVHYSPPHFGERVTRYEDRAVQALIEAHARVLGIELVAEREADLDLYVNGSGRAQQEAASQLLGPRPNARHRAFAQAVATALDRGRQVAIADLGYANGGDRSLLAALLDRIELPRLSAYAAWNTAGNTVGTVLAHATLRWLQLRQPPRRDAERAHLQFLLERFLDDTVYQSEVRNEIGLRLALERTNIYALGERHAAVEAQVAERLNRLGTAFFDQHFRGQTTRGNWRIEGPLRLEARLPWPRIFEVELSAAFDLDGAG